MEPCRADLQRQGDADSKSQSQAVDGQSLLANITWSENRSRQCQSLRYTDPHSQPPARPRSGSAVPRRRTILEACKLPPSVETQLRRRPTYAREYTAVGRPPVIAPRQRLSGGRSGTTPDFCQHGWRSQSSLGPITEPERSPRRADRVDRPRLRGRTKAGCFGEDPRRPARCGRSVRPHPGTPRTRTRILVRSGVGSRTLDPPRGAVVDALGSETTQAFTRTGSDYCG